MRSSSTLFGRIVRFARRALAVSQASHWLTAFLLAVVAPSAWAQDDAPDRVGRIASISGPIWYAPEDQTAEWTPVDLNYPITSGDNLWVQGEGTAEVDYGGGQFRIGADTNLHVARLDDRQLALFLAQGRLIVRLRFLEAGESAQVDTPNAQVQLNRTGLYRIDVTPDGQTVSAIVREGEAIVWIGGSALQVQPGETGFVDGPDPALANVNHGVAVDDLDTWSADRDRLYEGTNSAQYVSRQMIGAADLDRYGVWETYPEFGPVWFPADVAPGWVPYRDGYWTALGGWGLTWVDSAPWGYAPSHYGRWTQVGGRWGWCPGKYVARPAWAPALVGWYGGPGWNPSRHGNAASAPMYGWVPLAWGEAYRPGWVNCSERCWSRHNQPYAAGGRERAHTPPGGYVNLGIPGAGSVMASPGQGRSKPQPITAVVPPDAAARAPVLGSAPRVPRGSTQAARSLSAGGERPVPASTLYRTRPPPNPQANVGGQGNPRMGAGSLPGYSGGSGGTGDGQMRQPQGPRDGAPTAGGGQPQPRVQGSVPPRGQWPAAGVQPAAATPSLPAGSIRPAPTAGVPPAAGPVPAMRPAPTAGVPPAAGPVAPMRTAPTVPPTGGPVAPMRAAPTVPPTGGPVAPMRTAPTVPPTGGPAAPMRPALPAPRYVAPAPRVQVAPGAVMPAPQVVPQPVPQPAPQVVPQPVAPQGGHVRGAPPADKPPVQPLLPNPPAVPAR